MSMLYFLHMQWKIFKNASKEIIIISIVIIVVSFIAFQQFFSKNLTMKTAIFQEEQQLLTEQFNKKLAKLTKNFNFVKEENRSLQELNHTLEKKLEELEYTKENINYQLTDFNNKIAGLEGTYNSEKNVLQQKIAMLKKDNVELQELIKELQQQIKNHKDNSYSLFQAGKLEVELSKIEQQILEQYDNILQKKNNLEKLKEKCGTLRMNTNFCKEYDAGMIHLTTLEKQMEHLQNKREDLKQRINTYLSSAKQ